MQASPLLWGLEADGTTPSLDSITGSEVIVVPDAPVRVGSDSTTSNTVGILVAAGATWSMFDNGAKYGVIDPNAIYFWNQNGAGMAVTFSAR